jgi:hypothetical protein
MTNKKLFELLKLVDGVNYNSWRIVNPLVDCIKEDESVVIKKEWHDSFKKNNPDWYPLDLSKIGTWSTYDSCVGINFTNVNNKLYCKVKIYDGDNMDGFRKGLRFTVELILPDKFLKQISGTIESYFDSYLHEAYERHLENQKKLFIYSLRNEILNKK